MQVTEIWEIFVTAAEPILNNIDNENRFQRAK